MSKAPSSHHDEKQGWPFLTRLVFWIIAGFYAYGALVHVLNMFSLTGFDWIEAPRKWQILDVAYLIIDVVVFIGLLSNKWIGIWAFFAAALSQITLYTFLRDWILDVPDTFRRSTEEIAYLDALIAFHIITFVVMLGAIYYSERKNTKV